MSEKQLERTVKVYLKEVEEKLPEWLKDKKDELRDILQELEEHIWDKAEELSEQGVITDRSVRLALAHMGSPETIAKEYKRRGTPYVYITQELWPYYKTIVGALTGVIVLANIVVLIFNLLAGNFDQIFVTFSNIFLGFFAMFTIVTVIFGALSMEGYLPEDFKSATRSRQQQKQIERAQELGLPVSKKTGKQLKPVIKPVEEFIGGCFNLVFGVIFVVLPTTGIAPLFHPAFLELLVQIGVLTIIEGLLDFSRAIVGNNAWLLHQIVQVIYIGLKIAAIPILVALMNRPEIIPILIWTSDTGLIDIGLDSGWYGIYTGIMGLIIFILVVSILGNIYRIVKFESYKR